MIIITLFLTTGTLFAIVARNIGTQHAGVRNIMTEPTPEMPRGSEYVFGLLGVSARFMTEQTTDDEYREEWNQYIDYIDSDSGADVDDVLEAMSALFAMTMEDATEEGAVEYFRSHALNDQQERTQNTQQ